MFAAPHESPDPLTQALNSTGTLWSAVWNPDTKILIVQSNEEISPNSRDEILNALGRFHPGARVVFTRQDYPWERKMAKCQKCEKEVDWDNTHECPYQSDVHNDKEFTCNCCENCMQNCADDI